MQKKDLLLVCQYFYPDHVSTGRLPTELAEDLVEQGLTVDVLCGFPSYIVFDDSVMPVLKREVYKGINIKRIRIPRLNKNSKISRLLNYFLFTFGALLRFPQFSNYKKVLLITNPPLLPYFGYLSKKFFHNKFIFLIYDLYPDIALALGVVREQSPLVKVMNYVNMRAFKAADAIVVLGEDMKRYLVEEKVFRCARNENKRAQNDSKWAQNGGEWAQYDVKRAGDGTKSGLDAHNIHVIPNWVDSGSITVKNKVNSFSSREGLEEKFVVLYSGNIGLFQDLEMIVECARLLKEYMDIAFVFVGEGGKKKKLLDMVAGYALQNVKFYGFQPDDIYNDVLASADCFAVTLEKAAEGLGVPSKTYTYLAAGRPLVGILSKGTDISRLLTDEKIGFQINHDDIQLLADKILYLYNNEPERLEMGRRARALLENRFDRKIVTEKYFKLIEAL